MIRNNIVFIGEENRTNNDLYQLLNWRFNVTNCTQPECVPMTEVKAAEPVMILVSLVGSKFDLSGLFEALLSNCMGTPIVTIGNEMESNAYNEYYEKEHFHRIMRPVTGKRVIDICRTIIAGKNYAEMAASESTVAKSDEKAHILVVDDNAMVLRNIKGILDEKYSVAVAPSGIKAFVAMGKKTPDLILLDYEMPEMNGKEVLQKIQEDEELSEIPVVFLTSADSKEIVMELLSLRPAGYLLKPVDADMLFHKIEEITGK